VGANDEEDIMAIGLAKDIARSLGRRLPERSKRTVKKVIAPLLFGVNTRGLGADTTMVAWARERSQPVSIVIPSYNDVPYLQACLASLEATCGAFDYEVIIVDDFCEPDNSEKLRALASERVRVMFKAARLGFAATVNAGMAEAKHDIVLLNSDIVAMPGWLEALQYSAYAIDPKIGMVSPKLIYPGGQIQYGGTYYARLLAPQWFGHLNVGSPATRPAANIATYNRSVSGACVYITREAFATLGLLDDEYWLGFEDVDYGLRAWQSGIRCYYQPASMLIHHESASRGYSQGKRELASMRYFWRRWEGLFLRRAMAAVSPVDYVLSERSTPLWRQYVEEQAAALRGLGREVTVHTTTSDSIDELLVSELASRQSIKISCDWGASVPTWLGSLEMGKPAYLLPGLETEHAEEAGVKARIAAQYKPEFDYIAPNRDAERRLSESASWETRGRVVPALAVTGPPPVGPGLNIVSLAAGPQLRRALDDAARGWGVSAHHFDESEPDAALVERMRAALPRVVVSWQEYQHSLAPLALMATGAAFVGRHNDRTKYEVLDGYNALLVAPGSLSATMAAVNDVMNDEDVWKQLTDNGRASAERAGEQNAHDMDRVLRSIAESSI
jgi:GT2 family glycosyltransferase